MRRLAPAARRRGRATQGAFSATVERVDDRCDHGYDDTQDHERCADCKGSGWYIGFTERRLCPSCDGSGYL